MELLAGIDAFRSLVERRMEVVTPEAVKSYYRQFMDLEPVWSGDLAFNYIFSVGAPYSGQPYDFGGWGIPPAPRRPVLVAATGHHQNSVPDRIPVGVDCYITNVLDYAVRIETEGSPKGYGWRALQGSANRWKTHVKLGVQEAIAKVKT